MVHTEPLISKIDDLPNFTFDSVSKLAGHLYCDGHAITSIHKIYMPQTSYTHLAHSYIATCLVPRNVILCLVTFAAIIFGTSLVVRFHAQNLQGEISSLEGVQEGQAREIWLLRGETLGLD